MKNMFSYLVLCSLLMSGYDSHADSSQSDSFFPQIIEDTSLAVWDISVRKKLVTLGGSGFFLSPYLFFTNEHLIRSIFINSANLSDIVLRDRSGQIGPMKIKSLLAVSPVFDIALLETDIPAGFHLKIRKEPIKQNNEVFFMLGYPLEGSFKILHNIRPISVRNERITLAVKEVPSLSGFSGGPLVDSKGYVAGIFTIFRFNMASFTLPDYLLEVQNNPEYSCKGRSAGQCLEWAMSRTEHKAEAGDVNAQFILGFLHDLNARAYKSAKDLLKVNGLNQADALLSRLLEESYALSNYWFKMATAQGHGLSAEILGNKYVAGRGVQQDSAGALPFFELAIEQNYPLALHNMALMYINGDGVEQNTEKGLSLMQKSAETGFLEAIYYLQKEQDILKVACSQPSGQGLASSFCQ